MSDMLIGIDVGGTKTQLAIRAVGGDILFNQTHPTRRWRGESFSIKAQILAEMIRGALTEVDGAMILRAVAIGAHGCDLASECRALEQGLAPYYPAAACRVVSDVALVALAAGEPEAIGLIAGTGSVAIARTPSGDYIAAGGWGWLLGDEGGASGLVREAIKAVLLAYDLGQRDDPLSLELVRAFAVGHLLDLPARLNEVPVREWSCRAPLIFDWAQRGSPLARTVIFQAAQHLADLVNRLRARGVVSRRVIAAGGVISRQPLLLEALRQALDLQQPGTRVQLLDVAPVNGALLLARTLFAPA